MLKDAVESLKSTPEHILKARDMASSIYKEPTEKHVDMLREIKTFLQKLHELEISNISNV